MPHDRLTRTYVRRGRRLKRALLTLYRNKRTVLCQASPLEMRRFLAQEVPVRRADRWIPRCADGTTPSRVVDVGFGKGESLRSLAVHLPQSLVVGVEVYREGIAKLLRDLPPTPRVRVVETSVLSACREVIPASSLDAVHIFFPDPWPKARHHKRRLLQSAHMDLLLKPLKVGGYIYFVSDWQHYAEETLALFEADPRLSNRYYRWAPRQEWRVTTKYEAKALSEKRVVRECIFDKIAERP